jgi:hypothetical protein
MDVTADFVSPILAIVLRQPEASFASVPETSVYEYRNFIFREPKVGSAEYGFGMQLPSGNFRAN